MGERLSKEVFEVIKQKPNLRKNSFVAHSVGGLVGSYAIRRLYKPPTENPQKSENLSFEESKPTIGGLLPVNFITVATPHLGSRGNKQVPFLFGVYALEKVAVAIVHWIFRRTGRHLFLMPALRCSHRRLTYANVGYDRILLHRINVAKTYM